MSSADAIFATLDQAKAQEYIEDGYLLAAATRNPDGRTAFVLIREAAAVLFRATAEVELCEDDLVPAGA